MRNFLRRDQAVLTGRGSLPDGASAAPSGSAPDGAFAAPSGSAPDSASIAPSGSAEAFVLSSGGAESGTPAGFPGDLPRHDGRSANPSGTETRGHPGHTTDGELWRQAAEFTAQFHREALDGADPAHRLAAIRAELDATGTYVHTADELAFGARVAWRNANRCIGRLYWRSLRLRDRRHVRTAAGIAAECVAHLHEAGNGGRIRPLITVFAPDAPGTPAPRIWNEQLIRYAGYTAEDGTVTGDPRNAGLTALARGLGWPGGPGTPFDVLPLVVQEPGHCPQWYALPPEAVLEVPIEHPEFGWFELLGLRWHAVPALANLCLEIGGICYPSAPFNGWYMGTEIGARNFADTDRYDLLPVIASRLGLDLRDERSLWRDRALVELNRAVLHSFDRAGVTVTDHHTESRRFLTHIGREERSGRPVGADWSWIVPPISGSATPVFHRTYDATQRHPAYVHHPEARARASGNGLFSAPDGCPVV